MSNKEPKLVARPITKSKEVFQFGVATTSLGIVLVAASDMGITAIRIGTNAAHLQEEMHIRFPDIGLVPGGRDFKKLLKEVISYIEAPTPPFQYALDMRGTAFQQRVWRAVRKIPLGETSTYSDIAREIGSPRAMRAVGSACTNNTLSIAVPCHKVLRKNGAPSGQRQTVLIQREIAFLKKRK